MHAWRVSLHRRGKNLVKTFPDKKHGGKRKALQNAKQHRDELLTLYPPLTRMEFVGTLRRNNISGVPGVCLVHCKYHLVDGEQRHLLYWEAICPTKPGKHVNRRFSVALHGDAKAFELACEARQESLNKLEGVFWAAERGVR
jgi:hypothetical protein